MEKYKLFFLAKDSDAQVKRTFEMQSKYDH